MAERTLSFWGWGWTESFPGPAERLLMAEQFQTLLGFPVREPREAPRIEDVELRPARVAVPSQLSGFCSAAADDRIRHTYGRSYRDLLLGFRGDFSPAPDFVAFPTAEDQISAVLAWAVSKKVAVVPYGGGTGVVGGVECDPDDGYHGVVSLDMRRFNKVLAVDLLSQAARIQAGATGPELEAQLGEHDLTLRHFPQSFEFSTLGGWIATRAGGHFATLYTHIDDLVESVRMITPRGVFESKQVPRSGAGPSPDRLILGSEGALGVITEAWVRVRPRPRFRSRASVFFREFSQAVAATRAIAQSGLNPANCRLLDRREAMLNGVTFEGQNVLLLGFEAAEYPTATLLDQVLSIALEYDGVCPEGPKNTEGVKVDARTDAASLWRQAFFEAPYLQSGLVSLGIIADTFETSCTWECFERLHGAVIENVREVMKRHCGRGFLSCRFTHVYPDGPAPYYTFMAPGKHGQELEQWRAIKEVAADTVLAHGGTITHHHAVGRLHRPWFDRDRPPLWTDAMRNLKRALDPAGILNPGVLFSLDD